MIGGRLHPSRQRSNREFAFFHRQNATFVHVRSNRRVRIKFNLGGSDGASPFLKTSDTHARLLLAATDAKKVRVRHATQITAANPQALAKKIGEVVAKWNCASAKTLVALERDDCELRRLAVPDVGPDEVPDLVRYQALQNFSTLGADWPLDFISLPKESRTGSDGAADRGNHVLAGAISPARIKAIESLCDEIGCPLEGIILRPCATAVLVHHVVPAASGAAQVVIESGSLASETANILVTSGAKAVLMRSVRLPSGAADQQAIHKQLQSEVRRTIGAAMADQPDLKVSRVVICGNGLDQKQLADSIRKNGDLAAVCVKNWDGARVHKSVEDADLRQPERFLPLIGMVKSELAQTDSVIDFRRPRERPPAPDNSRTWKALALLAALLLIGSFFGVRWMLGERDNEIIYLQKQINVNTNPVKEADEIIDALHAMENWHQNSPNWLEELNHLSENLPPGEQARLKELFCVDQGALSSRFIGTKDRARVGIKGFLDGTATLSRMHDAIRDDHHRVESGERNQKPEDRDYPWQFGDTVYVTTGVREPEAGESNETSTPDAADETSTAPESSEARS